MKVLIGYSTCEITRLAFEKAGCEAWTCDLRPSTTNNHIQQDIWEVLNGGHWDFALLHPMCTYLTVSAAWAFKDGPYHLKVSEEILVGEKRREARQRDLDNFSRLLDLPFPVAIENPASSFVNKYLRPPDQIIHPWMFGDDASKATGLWLTKGTPKLIVDSKLFYPPRLVTIKDRSYSRWSNQTDSGQNRLPPSKDRWLTRSKTYPGFAYAAGLQWGQWLLSK
jgi:hypothetical protein